MSLRRGCARRALPSLSLLPCVRRGRVAPRGCPHAHSRVVAAAASVSGCAGLTSDARAACDAERLIATGYREFASLKGVRRWCVCGAGASVRAAALSCVTCAPSSIFRDANARSAASLCRCEARRFGKGYEYVVERCARVGRGASERWLRGWGLYVQRWA